MCSAGVIGNKPHSQEARRPPYACTIGPGCCGETHLSLALSSERLLTRALPHFCVDSNLSWPCKALRRFVSKSAFKTSRGLLSFMQLWGCKALLRDILRCINQGIDPQLPLAETIASLLVTEIHLIIRFSQHSKEFPTLLWKLTSRWNAPAHLQFIQEFIRMAPDQLDYGYSLSLQNRAWRAGVFHGIPGFLGVRKSRVLACWHLQGVTNGSFVLSLVKRLTS